MPLTSAAITATTVETAVATLWREWLLSYFDGLTHTVAGVAGVTVPSASVTFGQGPPSAQPLGGLEVRVLHHSGGQRALAGHAGRTIQAQASFLFLLLASPAKAGSGDVHYQVRRAADLLYALLNHPADRYPLSPKGICQIRPTVPEVVKGVDYAARQLRCSATLRW